ncbi:MAG: bifunctional 3'-5' exonuclease/DNA polymerase, partial [Natronosporangium sp.]
ALLGAMYGQTGGSALPAIGVLRQRYPTAWQLLEQAARTGENGGLVRSWLGRTCPPPAALADGPSELGEAGDGDLDSGATGPDARARARGRFTRNFVIQATAAEWAVTMLACLRTGLAELPAASELVFFQHDEVLVHCPESAVDAVTEAVHAAAAQAGRLLFGQTPVRFPLDAAAVRCYADAGRGDRLPEVPHDA